MVIKKHLLSLPKVILYVIPLLFSIMILPGIVLGGMTEADIAALKAQGEIEGWTFTVSANPATQYDLDELCGLVMPADWQSMGSRITIKSDKSLPARFDWRDSTTLPVVKNQGGCGSCWAFATVGPLECNIKLHDGIEVDLSEQWLVRCNSHGWDCSGGWWAHAYHQWRPDPCGDSGAVLEAEYPYTASNGSCDCPYEHSYLIANWSYVDPDNNPAAVNLIKQAILDYGPVAVAVYADGPFMAYSGGVFNECSEGTVNHGVVIVGWDDDQGPEGVWFMRNSWGTGWGENEGYMRIAYNCNGIGVGASFVVYEGNPPIITTTQLFDWTVDSPYSQQLTAYGGTGILSWEDKHGDLSGSGLVLEQTGSLTGTPISPGIISFIAKVTDDLMLSDEKYFTFEVNPALQVSTSSLPEWTVDIPFSQQLEAIGGTGARIWNDKYSDLDNRGLTLSSIGLLSGTPTSPDIVEFTAEVLDGTGAADESVLELTINQGVAVSNNSLPEAIAGRPYSCQLTCTGGTGEMTWAMADDGLSGTGLSLSTAGQVSGSAETEGEIVFAAQVTDELGSQDENEFTLTVVAGYMCGDANGDETINVGDAVLLINYVFSDGPAPHPLESGDANCDGNTNVADAVYLISYVFSGGAEPCCP